MGESRSASLAALVVMLLIASALGPVLVASAATNIFPDVVYRGTLSTVNERVDYNFTAATGDWTVVATNIYEGTGSYDHGLRTNISSKNPIVKTPVGSIHNTRPAGVIAINGHDLSSDTDYSVSEELTSFSPSYAMQLKTGLTTLSRNSQTVPGDLGPDGIVMAYEINLQKRDTIDLRLRIPPEWTYNYHFALLLFSPNGRYHQWEGSGGTHPVAYSDAGENSEQALVYVAMDPGTYLIVLLNQGVPDEIMYDLEVGINGLPLGDGDIDEETLTRVNLKDYYRIDVDAGKWSAAVVKARGEIDRTFTHSLHWPTPDSNEMAMDELTDDSPVGIIALNGYQYAFDDTYFIKEEYDSGGTEVPFTVQFASSSMTLPSVNATTPGSLTSSDIFTLYEIDLRSAQTADFRLQVDSDYNYDYDLGMYVFPPEDKYYSISGERPEFASGPTAQSRSGGNTEQNVVFTAPMNGIYSVIIVNFALRDDIPFDLDVTIQGRALVDDTPLIGDLNEQNREDLYQFQALPDGWNMVGSRLASSDGSYWHNLHSTALDTNPIIQELVGYVPGSKKGQMDLEPVGLIGVNGYELSSSTRYFVREEVEAGSPVYIIELENSPRSLSAMSDNLTGAFRADEFLETYVVDLAERDTIDITITPPAGYSYPYQFGLYVFAPGALYRNLGTEGDVAAMAIPGDSRDPTLMYTASVAGEYMIVVANLGTMESLDYELVYAVNGFPSSLVTLNTGVLDEDNTEDAFNFNAVFDDYTLVVVRLPEVDPVSPMTATLRWPSIDSVALSTLELTEDDPVGAFVIDGTQLQSGNPRHYILLTAEVPGGRTLSYQIQITYSTGSWPGGAMNFTEQEIGASYSPTLNSGSTADISLRMPPDYTYSYDLGLFVFAPDAPYMSTTDPEAGPRAWCANGPGTEQEIIFTSKDTVRYAVVVLNLANLGELAYIMDATVDGRLLSGPLRGFVDDYNQNEQYRFVVSSDSWSALSSAYITGGGTHALKLLTNGLYTNPVAMAEVGQEEKVNTGVIAIHGWGLDTPEKTMFANISQVEGMQQFVVHANTNATEFGPIGHIESDQFREDEIVYIYTIDLTVGDNLEIILSYDQGNWSSDVHLELQIFQPLGTFRTTPAHSIGLKVSEGRSLIDGKGTFLADDTGTFAFIIVNKGSLGPVGFSLGVYRQSAINLPPLYPAILKTSSTTDSVTIEWAPDQGSDFDKYEVYISTESNDMGDKVDTITNQALSKYTYTGLDPGTKYYCTVVTYDNEGLYTASNPYTVKTKELPIYAQLTFWVIVLAIVAAVVFIVGFDWFIRRQKADRAATSEKGASTLSGTSAGTDIDVETIEAGASTPAARGRPVDAATADKQEAVDFMKEMMGDEE